MRIMHLIVQLILHNHITIILFFLPSCKTFSEKPGILSADSERAVATNREVTDMKVFMIGGTGLLGSEAARELIARGHEVSSLALPPLPAGICT